VGGILWTCLALAAAPAVGQVPGDTVVLTVEEAVALALATSEEVRIARTQRELADAQITQARAGALPQISSAVMYNRTLASIFDDLQMVPPPAPGEEPEENPLAGLPFGRPNTWNASLQVSQPIYTGGRVGTALAIARNVRAAADFQIEDAEADIALQVRSTYFQLLLADRMVGIAVEAFELADATLRQVELFWRQGIAAEFDVLRAQVDRDNLEPAIVEAENARRVAELNLKRLINLPAEQPIVIATPLDAVIADVDRGALEEALQRLPALRALDEQIAAREGAIRIARADRLPNVSASGNFSYQAFPTQVAPFDANWRRDWSLSIQASIPIFNGFRTRGQVDQARAELELAELQRRQVREGLDLEFQAALGEFDAARAQIDARRGTVAQAERALELAELRFSSGLSTQLDISNARFLLQQARVNEAQALYHYVTVLARLERVSGGEVPLLDPRLLLEND
jgi:outer membrane protein